LIIFDPKTHTYTDQNGEKYVSVTTLLSREFPFNEKEIADKVRTIASSKYHGMTTSRILKLWEDSSDHGNVVHEAVEDYIKRDVWPSDNSLVPLVEQFSKLNFKGDLLSEVLLWDEKYKLAGTADILECFDSKIYLFDIKTSNKIGDNKLMKFSMQLELYRRMIEKQFNKKTESVAILWYADYVLKRSKTKLKLLQPLRVNSVVNDLLQKRLNEIAI